MTPEETSANPIATPPLLQIPAPTSMGIGWGVNTLATGFVDYSTDPSLANATRIFSGSGPQKSLDDLALNVRLTGLQPNTRYYYRIGVIPIDFRGAYDIHPGEEVIGEIYSFTTPGREAPSTFAVISDTHEVQEAMALLARKIDEIGCQVVVWNGDINSHCSDLHKMRDVLLHPGHLDLAASRPVLYMPGNHDYRGFYVRDMPRIMMMREPTERASKHHSLGRNYAYRQGDIALIGLDTGEDKADWRREWGQLANFTPYRKLQAEWLAEVLERDDIKNAPYIVAICHIPLYDPDPEANPGDNEVDYAAWQRHCNQLWSPLFEEYGVQLVITGHRHKYRYDAPTAERPWAQIVNDAGLRLPPASPLTLITGAVVRNQLEITVHNLSDGSILDTFTYAPRLPASY